MKPMDDARTEHIIGQLLRAGVLLSAFIVLVGGVVYLIHAGHDTPDFYQFHGLAPQLKSIPGVIAGAIHLEPESVIQLGLLLLIATPIARVAFSIVAFSLERDWMYVALTFVVLGVLLYSLLQTA